MNKYKVRNELIAIANKTTDSINKELEYFDIKFKVFISEHVADRIIDRSTNIVTDIRNINYLMQQLVKNYIGNLIHYSNNTHRLLLYFKYKRNINECFALGTTLHVDGNLVKFTIRTFMPDFRVFKLSNKVKLHVRESTKRVFNVNSPLQRMIYSHICPDELKMLRD